MTEIRSISKVKRTLFLIVCIGLVGVFGLSGCFETSTDKKLIEYASDSKVVAVRYYVRTLVDNEYTYESEELPAERLDEFMDVVDSFELNKYFAHSDYFWAGQYGIEFTLEDGTYLSYDGTKLLHLKIPAEEFYRGDSDNMRGALLKDAFIGIKNADFWDEMHPFFTTLDDEIGYSSLG